MTETEAAHLVNLLIGTWPAGPRGYVWRDVLRPLEHPIADLTYRQLRNHNERITVAEYLDAYTRHTDRRDAQNLFRQRQATRDIEPAEEEISLDEYLQRLHRRAAAGSLEAQQELAAWRRHRNNTGL